MVMKELEKNPEMKNEDWSSYLPPIPKSNKNKNKKIIKKEKKEYSPFPNPI